MASPSNFYAEKVLSEHPISLWALDDAADFISYLSSTNRNLAAWTASNATVSNFSGSTPVPPITSANTNSIVTSSVSPAYLTLTSPSGSFTSTTDTFTISFYLYSFNGSIGNIEIGYQDGTSTPVSTTISGISANGKWKLFSATFSGTVTSGKVIIKINYTSQQTPIDFLINGLAVGNRTEEFNGVSIGEDAVTIPSSISATSMTQTKGILAINYGMKSLPGYYIIESQKLIARNSTIPMVYGASNSTVLTPSSTSGQPSLIIPGAGFMNEVNESMDMTFEGWFKINSIASSPKKIFGPINSNDGLYVNGPFLMLKIGKDIQSHYVGEWFRPMLIQISISPSSKMASLTVNGKLIFTMNLSAVSFLTKYDSGSKDQDWLGFYSYSDVPSIEVDCVGVYPYIIDQTIANRRYVYAQGVEFPKNIDVAYGGETVYSDYSFSKYSNNYNYPEIGKWKSGLTKNAIVNTNYVSPPNFELPSFIFPPPTSTFEYTINTLCDGLTGSFINLRPTSAWNGKNSYIAFNGINVLQSSLSAIYGIFKSPSSASSAEQTLIKLVDLNGNYMKISMNGSTIYHKVKINSDTETTFRSNITGFATSTFMTVGININKLKTLDAKYSQFFGNLDALTMYIGGESVLDADTNMFTGEIHQIAFCDAYNFAKISSDFGSDGTVSTTASSTRLTHYPSYGLVANRIVDRTYIDIKANSYWEDNIPVSMLSTYVSPSNIYSVNFLQFNLDYPDMDIFSSGKYDTTNSLVKSYITFQYTGTAFKDFSTFTPISMPQNGEVTPNDTSLTWKTDKYEVVNNAIVYVPQQYDYGKTNQDLSVVMHLEMFVNGITNNPLKIKSLQIAAKTLDSNTDQTPINEVGTRFTKNLYPMTVESGVNYFDRKNSFTVGKDINQYLCLTSKTGFRLSGDYNSSVDRSLMFQVNENKASGFNFSAVNTALLYTESTFPTTARKIMEIVSASATLRFYVVSANASNTRGRIYCNIVSSGSESLYTDISYYWNGNLVDQPYINIKEWGMLGILFNSLLRFDNIIGQVKLSSNMLFNSFSYYQLSENKQSDQIVGRQWGAISAAGAWSIWSSAGTWQNVSVVVTNILGAISPSSTYQMLIGTNRLIFDADAQTGKPRLHGYKYSVFGNLRTSSQILQPQ